MSNARELSQAPNQAGRKNILYNGAMQVAQRGTSFTGVTTSQYTLDRWEWASTNGETVTIEQASDHPSGVGQSLKFTVTTADASPAGYTVFHQKLEGADVQHLRYGSSNAKSVTISFWVKASETGDYSVNLYTITATAQIIGSTFTVNSANTWEYKTVTFVGDTATVIPNIITEGLRLTIGLSSGATYNATDNTSWGAYSVGKFLYGQTANLIGTVSATFQITDVQMEVGEVATEFEQRSYGEEFVSCCRYYQEMNLRTAVKGMGGVSGSGNTVSNLWTYIYPMRTQPTATSNSTAPAYYNAAWITSGSSAVIAPYQDYFAAGVSNTGIGAGTDFLWRWANGANMFVYFNAEL